MRKKKSWKRNNWSLPCRNSIWYVYIWMYFKVQRIKAKMVLAYSNRSTWLHGCLVPGRCWLGLRSRENTLELLLKAFLGSLALPVWAFVVCFPFALVFLFGCRATENLRLESKADSVSRKMNTAMSIPLVCVLSLPLIFSTLHNPKSQND